MHMAVRTSRVIACGGVASIDRGRARLSPHFCSRYRSHRTPHSVTAHTVVASCLQYTSGADYVQQWRRFSNGASSSEIT